MELLGLLLSGVLKDLGNISAQKRTSYVLKERIQLILPSCSAKMKEKQTVANFDCSFDVAGFPISSHLFD